MNFSPMVSIGSEPLGGGDRASRISVLYHAEGVFVEAPFPHLEFLCVGKRVQPVFTLWIIARKGLLCRRLQKSMCVCPFVRPSVRPSVVRSFVRPTCFWTLKMVPVMGIWFKKGFQMFKYGHVGRSEQ